LDRSFASILQDIVSNVQTIVRAELRLAVTEIRADAGRATSALVRMVVGAVLALYGGLFVLVGVMYVLTQFMPQWLSALVVGVAVTIASIATIKAGLHLFKRVDFIPEKTIQSVKEQAAWPKAPHT
jgi:uncharacterized membrane protein YqjE